MAKNAPIRCQSRGQSYLLPPYAPALVYVTFFAAGLIMFFGLHRHLRSDGMGLIEFLSLSSNDLIFPAHFSGHVVWPPRSVIIW
jgi:hypothetical protein